MTLELNTHFGIKDELVFREDASGLVVAQINNALCSAELSLQGAHLMSWHPKSQSVPVVWLSRDTRLAAGKSLRGGVPVCWPWFGAHATESIFFPGHGFARTVPWRMIESATLPDGATKLMLRLEASDKTRLQWPHECTVELTVIIGETLRMELSTANTGDSDFVLSEALHTYFKIGDISAVRVTGLEGCEYWDMVGGSNLWKQQGDIRFDGEVDRVYVNTGAACVIHDDLLKRRIHIAKSGSQATVVWTPWIKKAARMGDMGQPDGWREMICVESVNAMENVVTVAAGVCHTLMVEYRVESI